MLLFLMGAVDVVAGLLIVGMGDFGLYLSIALFLKGGMSILNSPMLRTIAV